MKLNQRQLKFIDEFALYGNAAEAARRAGYSERSAKVVACRLTNDNRIAAKISQRQAEYAAKLELTRQDVLNGLLKAVELARQQVNPAAMVSAWREIGRVIGCYQPEVRQVELSADAKALQYKFAAMSDEELLEVISEGNI